MILDSCAIPIVLAPLAGGPSTPELAAAVSNAGGLGFLAAGYLPAAELADRCRQARALTPRPFGVNLFVPGPPGDADEVRRFAARIEADVSAAGARLGQPRHDDDDWAAKLDYLTGTPAAVVSFTFGIPGAEVIADPTRLTRAFSGRTARGIENGFLRAHSGSAPAAYPEVHHLTSPMRKAARQAGLGDYVNLWAGQAYPLTGAAPAGDLVREFWAQARAALSQTSAAFPA